MATATLKCTGCKERFKREVMIKLPAGNFHSMDCAIEYANKKSKASKEKAEKAKHREDTQKIKSKTTWFDQLQVLVNQYIVQVRDKYEACATCGTRANVKYDAGHYLTRGAHKELRFELTNIHKQCSVKCNQHGSGMRLEHQDFIRAKYGQEHLDWLEGPHSSLKAQFPSVEAIKTEMVKYRVILRENGIRPNM